MDDTTPSPQRTVLVTDYAWKNLDLERRILARVGASLVVAQTGVEDELISLAAEVDGILTCWKAVTEKVIANAPHCQAIGRYGIGLDNIDVKFATRMGIVVTNVPAFCVEEVSDHAMALLLSLARKVVFYDQAIKQEGRYSLRAGAPLYRIHGKTLGIFGFGKIGRTLYRKAKSFGLRIITCDPWVDVQSVEGYDVERVSFQDLLRRSDYLSIHTPLTAETRFLFNREAFRQMKPTAFLINTARGEIIEGPALLEALNRGLIAGAALDVLPKEPPDPTDPLVLHAKAIITPHAAFNSEESLVELQESAATQMADALAGKLPSFVVNPEVLTQENLRLRLQRTS